MARIPSVTRTIKATHATVMCVDTDTAEVCNKDIILPRTYEGEKDMLKAAKKVAETDTVKVVSVVHSTVTETLYGMTEADFIKYAKPMPPRTTANGQNPDTAEGDTLHLPDDLTSAAPDATDVPAEG